ARAPFAEALGILLKGHALPTIDPALEGGTEATGAPQNGVAVNGKAHVAAPAPAPAASFTPGASAGVEAAAAGTPPAAGEKLASQMAARTSLSRIGGKDVFEKCFKFMTADNARSMGVYPFFRPLDFNNGPEAQLEGRKVVMLGSNNYLGLTTHPRVREAAKPAIEKYSTS